MGPGFVRFPAADDGPIDPLLAGTLCWICLDLMK
jgi:hypothetical protein